MSVQKRYLLAQAGVLTPLKSSTVHCCACGFNVVVALAGRRSRSAGNQNLPFPDEHGLVFRKALERYPVKTERKDAP